MNSLAAYPVTWSYKILCIPDAANWSQSDGPRIRGWAQEKRRFVLRSLNGGIERPVCCRLLGLKGMYDPVNGHEVFHYFGDNDGKPGGDRRQHNSILVAQIWMSSKFAGQYTAKYPIGMHGCSGSWFSLCMDGWLGERNTTVTRTDWGSGVGGTVSEEKHLDVVNRDNN